MKKQKTNTALYIILGIILCSISINATTITLNRDINLSIGDCWNDKLITNIDGLTLTVEKGCNKSISNDTLLNETITNKTEINNISINNCRKIKGNGIHNIIVSKSLFKDEEFMLDFGNWVYNTLNSETPYIETTWNLYYENIEGDCKFDRYSDFRIKIAEINSLGWSEFNGININKITFSKDLEIKGYSFKWRFLLLHELTHSFAIMGHVEDGSIMSMMGGNSQLNEEQIDRVRQSLNG
jgi:hypothetical protein